MPHTQNRQESAERRIEQTILIQPRGKKTLELYEKMPKHEQEVSSQQQDKNGTQSTNEIRS